MKELKTSEQFKPTRSETYNNIPTEIATSNLPVLFGKKSKKIKKKSCFSGSFFTQ